MWARIETDSYNTNHDIYHFQKYLTNNTIVEILNNWNLY